MPILLGMETPDLFDFDDPSPEPEPEPERAPRPQPPARGPAPAPRPGGQIWGLGGRIAWVAGLILMLSSFMSWYAGKSVEGPTLAVIGWHTGTIGKLVFFVGPRDRRAGDPPRSRARAAPDRTGEPGHDRPRRARHDPRPDPADLDPGHVRGHERARDRALDRAAVRPGRDRGRAAASRRGVVTRPAAAPWSTRSATRGRTACR